MTKLIKPYHMASLLLLGILVIYSYRLEAIGWFFWHNNQSASTPHALNLKNYQVTIEGLAIGDFDNASGLTYNTETNTLFTVLNQDPKLIELSLKGEVLRVIHIHGVDDMEGITHIEGNHFVIADERDSRLILINIADNTKSIDVTNAPKFRLGINEKGNKNFEGVSWDKHQNRLLVVKERDPKYVLAVKGLVNNPKDGVMNFELEKLSQYDKILWAMRDLSSINYISKSGHMLLLSEESNLIKELDENARPLGALSLWRGFHGLSKSIPQAEGVTIDTNDNIYIISEPNLFYVFSPTKTIVALQK
ncbi:MAG: SdiA-regulated domain-containing protein [Methylotenera sp.]